MLLPCINISPGLGFGVKRSYGFHEGQDRSSGYGNADIGHSLIAIADGEVTNYKVFSNKPISSGQVGNWGIKIEYRIDGPWGSRYVQYSHCNKVFVSIGQKVKEGQVIAEIGTTGAESAHVHWSIAKKAGLFNSLAKLSAGREGLEANWEDPEEFVEKWKNLATDNKGDEMRALTILKANKFEGSLEGTMAALIEEHKRFKEGLKNREKLLLLLGLRTDSQDGDIENAVKDLIGKEDSRQDLINVVEKVLGQSYDTDSARNKAILTIKETHEEEVKEIKTALGKCNNKIDEWHKKKDQDLLGSYRIDPNKFLEKVLKKAPKVSALVIKVYKEGVAS